MKILLLGAEGQVGQEIVQLAKSDHLSIVALSRAECDISNAQAVAAVMASNIDYVINAAAFTAVDKAETDDSVFVVNAQGVMHLAKVCAEKNIPLIQLSTDYVFDGKKNQAYTEIDAAGAINRYGLSKWQGEELLRKNWEKHIILRISWVFGKAGHNFVKTILRLANEKTELRIVNDQMGCPTAAANVAEVLLQIIKSITEGKANWGTYHYCNKPPLTWYDFAKVIIALAAKYRPVSVKEIIPIATSDLALPARRPVNSILDCGKINSTFGIIQADWQPYLEKVMRELMT